MTKLKDIKLNDEVGGASTFLALTDTPNSYLGNALKAVRVNAGENALEFGVIAGGGSILLATTYDNAATTGLLFCSQYNVND